MKQILLMGNPNIGKSAIFSRLTGAKVIVSNYPGTTVEFTQGIMRITNKDVQVIDVPGTYTLEPTCKAEQVAVKMLDETFSETTDETVVVNIIDSTNLERSLNLTLQLIQKKIPMVIALNLWDETKHTGIQIDVNKLGEILNVPSIPTVAVTGEGIKNLVDKTKKARISEFKFNEDDRWNEIGRILEQVQTINHRHHTFLNRLEELSIKPVTGMLIAAIMGVVSFSLIRFIGEGIIEYAAEPFFEHIWAPIMMKLSALLGSEGVIHDIIIGKLVDGGIDFGESFGMITTGIFVPMAAVLPYVFAFYLVLSFLEDLGYLPRLAVLLDNFMHKLGLHGYGIIPTLLGLGCNVPGALSTRIMENRRERFLSAVLMAISVPCMAQIAMIAGLIGKEGMRGFTPVFVTLFTVWILLGIILNKTLKGAAPELFIEIPPYRMPYLGAVLKKVWMRIVWFVKEAVPWVLFGVFMVNLLYTFGVIDYVSDLVQPVVSGILGLPPAAVGALIVGFLRKDLAVGMLVPLGLDQKQLIIASVVLTMYFPCAATFAVFIREFGMKDMLKATAIMIISTLIVGGFLNLIL
jgi:ferrous iron transport protein B